MKKTSNIGFNIPTPMDPMGKRTLSNNIDVFGDFPSHLLIRKGNLQIKLSQSPWFFLVDQRDEIFSWQFFEFVTLFLDGENSRDPFEGESWPTTFGDKEVTNWITCFGDFSSPWFLGWICVFSMFETSRKKNLEVRVVLSRFKFLPTKGW